ncbi:Peptide methionine sulfoxide reductase MsrA [Rhodotorula toruloides]|uniref:peptide-methionine (S)-S-oxide reductase n=2 Tax=Rhodotorula toruloides TaxID=5286 RepID=A0A2T0A553_RHOTO|nr:Peptide methionine sulfoxide reductase MsrA [Rhodotorula toruloides]
MSEMTEAHRTSLFLRQLARCMLLHVRSLFGSAHRMARPTYAGPTLPTAIAASQALPSSSSGTQTAVVANGCFWGTEHMYRKAFKDKLEDVKVGYTGGHADSPNYRQVCSGSTNHAEACKITFDPSKVSYAELIEFHFRMHDPTQVNRQGPDTGTQYRTAIFTTSDEQAEIAKKVMAEVKDAHYPDQNIATMVEPLAKWWDAEDYHQEYLHNNPGGYECPSHVLHW